MTKRITIKKVNYGFWTLSRRSFWFEMWTPTWHKGRGPYITIGLYFIAFGRGY